MTSAYILYIVYIYSNALQRYNSMQNVYISADESEYTKRNGDVMNLFIDNKSGVPIYDQIYSQIKAQIISGVLPEDEALPSMRNLAKDLRISVITTKRAYEELEREGFIYTVAGKGCFVASKNVEGIREALLMEMEEHLKKVLEIAPGCNMTRNDIVDVLDTLIKEEGWG